MKKGTIIVYSIPAFGHINSMLYFLQCLKRQGYMVICYATEPFREVLEEQGCRYRSYPLDENMIDLTDGKRLIRLYRLLLENTVEMLPELLKEAGKDRPAGVIFDSLALWGRAVSEVMRLPGFSFYSIAAINGVCRKSFFCYAAGFSTGFFRYVNELPRAFRQARYLRRRYGLRHLGLLPVLMNRGDYNLMGYSRQMQPGGRRFGRTYLFLGPLSHRRAGSETQRLELPDRKLIYISLGTIFNEDRELFEAAVAEFGNQDVDVVVATALSRKLEDKLPDNFRAEPFVDQMAVLRQADLFLTAGGMNSLHEALVCGVPCLIYPQQGEQYLNARRFEQLGFGRIMKDTKQLGDLAARTMRLKSGWPEEIRSNMTKTTCKHALQIINNEIGKMEKPEWKKY